MAKAKGIWDKRRKSLLKIAALKRCEFIIPMFLLGLIMLLSIPARADCGGVMGVWMTEQPPKIVFEFGRTSAAVWVVQQRATVWMGQYEFEGGQLSLFDRATPKTRFPARLQGGKLVVRMKNADVRFVRVADSGGEYFATGRKTTLDPYTESLFSIYTDWAQRDQCGEYLVRACGSGDRDACASFEVWMDEHKRWMRGVGNVIRMLGEEAQRLQAQNQRRRAELNRQARDQIANSVNEANGYISEAESYFRAGKVEAGISSLHKAAAAQRHADQMAQSLKQQ